MLYREKVKCQRCQRQTGIISYNLPYTPECVFESKHTTVQSFSHLCRCESVHTLHGVCLATRGETRSQSHDPNHRIAHADSNTSLYFCVQVKKENFAPLLDEPCLIAQHLTLHGGKMVAPTWRTLLYSRFMQRMFLLSLCTGYFRKTSDIN